MEYKHPEPYSYRRVHLEKSTLPIFAGLQSFGLESFSNSQDELLSTVQPVPLGQVPLLTLITRRQLVSKKTRLIDVILMSPNKKENVKAKMAQVFSRLGHVGDQFAKKVGSRWIKFLRIQLWVASLLLYHSSWRRVCQWSFPASACHPKGMNAPGEGNQTIECGTGTGALSW